MSPNVSDPIKTVRSASEDRQKLHCEIITSTCAKSCLKIPRLMQISRQRRIRPCTEATMDQCSTSRRALSTRGGCLNLDRRAVLAAYPTLASQLESRECDSKLGSYNSNGHSPKMQYGKYLLCLQRRVGRRQKLAGGSRRYMYQA